MYEAEHRLAVAVVAEACRLGRTVQDEIVAASAAATKEDRSPVTIADLAIQAVVTHRLRAAFPQDPLLAEEDTGILSGPQGAEMSRRALDLCRTSVPDLDPDEMRSLLDRSDHTSGGRHWVLDPVDGTKGFLRGEHYAVALALVEAGRVVVGILGCPNLQAVPDDPDSERGCLFSAVRGAGSLQHPVTGGDGWPIRVSPIADPTRARLTESVESGHAAHDEHAAIAARLGITNPSFRIDGQCKYGVLARGEATVYLRLPSKKGYREKVWDHAAGSLVVEEAGGRVTDLAGDGLDVAAGRFLGTHHGIIATNGLIHDAVLEAANAVRP